MIDRERLLERFLRYVQVETTACEAVAVYPSSPGQLELGVLVVEELLAAGCRDALQNQHGLVTATVPATSAGDGPVVALNAHFDTSPEASGACVRPQVVRNYNGGDLPLAADPDKIIRVAENPELTALVGCTLITTDGTTLLGGDDKAGVAVIVEMAHYLCEHPELPHGDVRILFTCDEEIGRGVKHVDLDELAAQVAYTLDGPGANQIDVETFSADLAVVTFRGRNIHTSIAKGRMINAVRAAGHFLEQLPRTILSPETTDGRAGFVHPYQIEGGVEAVTLKLILRDFETGELTRQADLLRDAAEKVQCEFAGCQITVEIQPQYRNMREGLAREPRAVRFAEQAHQRLGRQSQRTVIRGGTDGSQLTELGLPTPNLSTGQHNPHSPLEWACLDEMVQAVEVLVELVQVWAEE